MIILPSAIWACNWQENKPAQPLVGRRHETFRYHAGDKIRGKSPVAGKGITIVPTRA